MDFTTSIGAWLAKYAGGKALDTALKIFREARVVERAIQKTNDRFTLADHRHSSDSIRPYLDEWIQSPAFERVFERFAAGEEVDEDHLVEQFLEVTDPTFNTPARGGTDAVIGIKSMRMRAIWYN